MIHAYNELYLNDAKILLANAMDYALNICKQEPNWFAKVFATSKNAKAFELGSPTVISGKSAEEFIKEILSTVFPGEEFPKAVFSQERSPEYWAGWALAYYQWYTAKTFKDIFTRVPLLDIISMYKVYHEMDISAFVEGMNARYNAVEIETNLKRIREARGLSQNELAQLSGVNKRSIQLYEQRVNDIDKSQVQSLYKLSRVLGCSIEDLLENPEASE